MNIATESFGTDWALPRLVDWFNSQTAAARTIPAGQLYLIKVTVLTTDDGTPVFVVGADTSLGDDSRQYVGDVTYLWIGPTGSAATATTASFYELSKTIDPKVNFITYTLTVSVGTMQIPT